MRRVTAAICRAQYEAGRLFFLDSAPEQPTLEPDRDGIAPRPARCHYYDGPLRRRDRGRPANQEGDATHVPSASNFRPPTSLLTPINSNLAATTETYPGAFVDQLLTSIRAGFHNRNHNDALPCVCLPRLGTMCSSR